MSASQKLAALKAQLAQQSAELARKDAELAQSQAQLAAAAAQQQQQLAAARAAAEQQAAAAQAALAQQHRRIYYLNGTMFLDVLNRLGDTGFLCEARLVSAVTSLCKSTRGEEALWDAVKDVQSQRGRTRLMHAARSGNLERARFLLARGARLEHKNKVGWTALHWAALRGRLSVLHVLLAP